MHGKAKVNTTLEEKERKKKERDVKMKAYQHSMNKIFHKRKNGEYDEEAMELISDVLVSNPDIYTLWNMRKEILLTFKDKSHDDLGCILSNEMHLTEICLRENPKSYAAWYHRLWLLDNMPYTDLEKELFLCTKYLKLDERNFHCWDYRRAVVARLRMAPSEELDYTTVKIEENFSNYSSWHYRSKLLPLVFPDPSGLRPIDEPSHLKELELVQAACFTDPSDSSSWFYLRWLLGRPTTKLGPVQAFITNGKIACVFSRCVSLPQPWIPYEKSRLIWTRSLHDEESEDEISFTLEYEQGLVENITLSREKVWSIRPAFDPTVSPALMSVLCSTLDSSNQLLDLEPESKWTLLTSIVLMQAIDKKMYKSKIIERLDLLIKYDYCRKNYYDDIRSKFIMEEALEELDISSEEVVLRNLSLTSLHHTHYLAFASVVDLSNNNLKRSLHLLSVLINCKVLIIDSNALETLEGFPVLPCLKKLSLCGNNLTSSENIIPFVKNNRMLQELNLQGNKLSLSQVESILKELGLCEK
ncbi:geranylgeranyl transferase type-2 subunit alpha isoform X2 [Halyomorpha halys]|uniref:geranylgeranyl transferase type-2 subunit alpha isoform X2 n=1 Tax=Halyomorpha halys TaxID=286706 RepID=UPI0006D5071A|nr:geranylgeranyl transferase type-2 subunit alpha isoform X2 [Halyomorpha halys]